MKKIIYILTVFTLLFSENVVAQNPNCFVTVNPLDTTICPGDSVFITGFSNLLGAGQTFNFNANALPPLWSNTGGAAFSQPCGISPSNTPYFWASTITTGTTPAITTAGFDITCGGVVIFDMVYAVQGGPSPCEGPDQYNEGVSLQYSLNNGVTWNDIVYYAPNGTILTSNPMVSAPFASGQTVFTTWQTYTVPIPAAALSTNTMFRWWTAVTSGSCCDNWGLDNIIINAGAPPCGTSTVMNWSNGLLDTTSFWYVATTNSSLYAIVTDTLGVQQCVSDTISVNVFNGNFTYNLPASANVFCPNASTTANVTNIQNAGLPVTYLWSTGSTTASSIISGQGVTPQIIPYFVTVTDDCGFTKADTINLNVNQTLVINSINMNPQINCIPNGSASAVVSGAQGSPVHVWTNAAGQTVNPVGNNANSLVAGWYYVTVTDNVCSVTDSVFVKDTIIPHTFSINPVTTNCLTVNPSAFTFSLANAHQPVYSWTTAAGAPLPFNNSSGTGFLSFYNLPNNGVSPATITYNVSVTSCGLTVTQPVVLTITNNNNLDFNLPPSVTVFCPGDSLAVDVTGVTGFSTTTPPIPLVYSWSNGDSTFTSWLTASDTTLEQNTTTYSVTVTDACGYTRTKTVDFITNKLLNITNMDSIQTTACQTDGSVVGFITGNTGPAIYLWQDSLHYYNSPAPNQGDSILASTWNNIGSSWYYFTVTDDVCFDVDSIYLDQIDAPIANFDLDIIEGCSGIGVGISNTSQNTTYYEWDFGNGNTINETGIVPHLEQYFTSANITLTAWDNASKTCGSSITKPVNISVCGCMNPNAINYNPNAVVESGDCVFPIPVVQDPNVFTPNGDGQNDLFFFDTEFTVEFRLTITNRWGNVMFDKILDLTAPVGNQGWDGRSPNGSDAQDGTYFYKYTAIGINGDEVSGKGFVQLVRN